MSRRTIDLNADLGEGFANDLALLERVTSASVACGYHAGDESTMAITVAAARRLGVVAGAHPSLSDADGPSFGREERDVHPSRIKLGIVEQIERLRRVAAREETVIRFVKPHGALYNMAQRLDEVAACVVGAVAYYELPLVGQPGTPLEARARAAGIAYVTEGFPDRRYGANGLLLPRTTPGAVLEDPAEVGEQALRLVASGVMTLCIHGDDPRAVTNADSVRAALRREGIALRGFVPPGPG
jgi:UPF0271 protein